MMKEDKEENLTVANWAFARPPTSTDRNQILHGGSLQGYSMAVKFHQNRLSSFGAV